MHDFQSWLFDIAGHLVVLNVAIVAAVYGALVVQHPMVAFAGFSVVLVSGVVAHHLLMGALGLTPKIGYLKQTGG